MATLKFTVRGSSNPSTIYARFTDGRKLHIIAKTDFLINPEFWDEVKATPKQKQNTRCLLVCCLCFDCFLSKQNKHSKQTIQ